MNETKRQRNARKARAEYQQQRDSRADQAVRMYETEQPDITVAQIAARLGVTEKSVYRYLEAAGIELKPQKRRGKNWANIRRAHQLHHEEGKGNNEIARIMGISSSQVSRYLNTEISEDTARN